MKTTLAKNLDPRPLAFTLIELLVVISIIGVLAALTIPAIKAVKHRQYINNAQAELAQLETAIERYHSAYGFYPPDSVFKAGINQIPLNQLYYELIGTTNSNHVYKTLDGVSQLNDSSLGTPNVNTAYGVGGFINCSKPGVAEDTTAAKSFIPSLKPKQYGVITNNNNNVATIALLCTVGGPDPTYPFGVSDLNPWRYNSSNPTNRPGQYDLYVQLKIAGKTNLICNWDTQVKYNSPLP
jgi:prepilin-type N-terminal cleavage/methylation domain-containing protein